jgi:foldase protein PrsA
VASVNGEKIDEQAFVNILKARYGDRVLTAMTGNMAIRQAARAAGVAVAKDELERRFMTAERAIEVRAPMTGENFEFWLAKQGLNREYFMSELYDQMLLEKMVGGQVSVSNADVASFYERNKQQIAEPATVRIAHICVKSEQEAQAIRSDILAKKITWEEAAKKYSLDPWTKDTGGDMGYVGLADTDFHKAAFALRANGDISAQVQSPMGIHIIKRLEFKEARVPKFEEVEQSLREQMIRRQTQVLAGRKREEILKSAKIEIITKLPAEAPPPAAAPAAPAAPAPAAP